MKKKSLLLTGFSYWQLRRAAEYGTGMENKPVDVLGEIHCAVALTETRLILPPEIMERNRNIVKIYERATPEVRKVLDELMMEICKKPMWKLVGFEQPKGG